MEFYVSVDLYGIWMRLFTDSDLPDTDNIVPFENTSLINQNKRQNKRKQRGSIRLIGVVFSNGTMSSVSDKSESVEHTHTDQQKYKISIF